MHMRALHRERSMHDLTIKTNEGMMDIDYYNDLGSVVLAQRNGNNTHICSRLDRHCRRHWF